MGTYSITLGLSTAEGCEGCALGSYTNLVGTGSTGCVLCAQGTYQPFANAWSNASCYPCPRLLQLLAGSLSGSPLGSAIATL